MASIFAVVRGTELGTLHTHRFSRSSCILEIIKSYILKKSNSKKKIFVKKWKTTRDKDFMGTCHTSVCKAVCQMAWERQASFSESELSLNPLVLCLAGSAIDCHWEKNIPSYYSMYVSKNSRVLSNKC